MSDKTHSVIRDTFLGILYITMIASWIVIVCLTSYYNGKSDGREEYIEMKKQSNCELEYADRPITEIPVNCINYLVDIN